MRYIQFFLIPCGLTILSASGHAFDEDFWIRTTASVPQELSYISNIAAAPCGKIFAATSSGLWSSSDNRESWNQIPITDNGIIVGVTILKDGSILVGGRDSIFVSNDCGEEWMTYSSGEHNLPQIDYYRFVEAEDGALYVATRDWHFGPDTPLSIWRSNDRGASWSLVCDDLTNGAESMCIGLHPNGDVFWGSWRWKGLFVYRSLSDECLNILPPGTEGERSWDALSMAINSRGEILVGTEISRAAYISSSDAGKNWTLHNHLNYHSPHGNIHEIVVDRHDNFFVSARDTVWYTTDLAKSWTRLPGYFDKFEIIHSLCLDSTDYLYVGTDQGNIYRSREPVYTTTGLKDSPADELLNFTLSPNPANGALRLTFRLEAAGLVTAELFDMRGTMVKQVLQRDYAAGSHSVKLDVDSLSAGVYSLRLSLGTEVLSRLVTVRR